MLSPAILKRFDDQFDDLRAVAVESQRRVIMDSADPLFEKYLNVFTKSYLVSACSILEAFIQDLAYAYLVVIQERVRISNLPHNLIAWQVSALDKSKDFQFATFQIKTAKADLSDLISGNYHKTIKAFEKIGVKLQGAADFERFRDVISATVDKRNKIVHHNDDASDLSLLDVIEKIDTFKAYAAVLYIRVSADPHLQVAAGADGGKP